MESTAGCAGSHFHAFWGVLSWVAALGLFHLVTVGTAILVTGAAILVMGCPICAILQMFVATIRDLCGTVGDTMAIGFAIEFLGVFGQPFALGVGLVPEVGEKHKEESAIHPNEVDDDGDLVVTALHEVILGSMQRHKHKLDLVKREKMNNRLT